MMHPLHEVLVATAKGIFPPVDGVVEVHPPVPGGAHAVVEFTGHAVVLTDRAAAELRARGAHGFGGAGHPDVLRWLAGPGGRIGSHDVVLVAAGTGAGGGTLVERRDLDGHPRVERARRHRGDVRVFGDERGLVALGHGLVGRLEMSVEREELGAVEGVGRDLIAGGLGLVEHGALVWAQVAPGNAASLRAFLACGFRPIGAETLIDPA